MRIHKTDSGLLHSNMYLIEEEGHAIVIDPCSDASASEKYTVDLLIVTHEHYDHISGVNLWKEKTGAPLLCSAACAENLKDPRKNMSRIFDVFCEMQTWFPAEEVKIEPTEYSCEADQTFQDRTVFQWQGHTVQLTEIPGHSAGSIGIGIDDTDFFSGDSLFEKEGIELRLPGGSKKQWEATGKKRIQEIREGTRIWPGHFEGFVLHKRMFFGG